MEPEGSLFIRSSTGPYPAPDECSPHYRTLIFLTAILILSSHLSLGLPSGLFRFYYQNLVCISRFSHQCYMPHPCRPPWLELSNNAHILRSLVCKMWKCFYGDKLFFPTPTPQTGRPLLIDCPWLLIHYNRSNFAYLKTVSSIRNPRMRHTVVTGIHTTWNRWHWKFKLVFVSYLLQNSPCKV
jgi:hypothetical protein